MDMIVNTILVQKLGWGRDVVLILVILILNNERRGDWHTTVLWLEEVGYRWRMDFYIFTCLPTYLPTYHRYRHCDITEATYCSLISFPSENLIYNCWRLHQNSKHMYRYRAALVVSSPITSSTVSIHVHVQKILLLPLGTTFWDGHFHYYYSFGYGLLLSSARGISLAWTSWGYFYHQYDCVRDSCFLVFSLGSCRWQVCALWGRLEDGERGDGGRWRWMNVVTPWEKWFPATWVVLDEGELATSLVTITYEGKTMGSGFRCYFSHVVLFWVFGGDLWRISGWILISLYCLLAEWDGMETWTLSWSSCRECMFMIPPSVIYLVKQWMLKTITLSLSFFNVSVVGSSHARS